MFEDVKVSGVRVRVRPREVAGAMVDTLEVVAAATDMNANMRGGLLEAS
jgi:hypothetical protein